MRNENDGYFFFAVELLHYADYFASAARIEHGGRFVKDHHVWFQRQNARNGDALLLPARKPRNHRIAVFFHADRLQGEGDALRDLLARQPHVLRAERDIVLHDRGNRLVIGILKDDPHPFA